MITGFDVGVLFSNERRIIMPPPKPKLKTYNNRAERFMPEPSQAHIPPEAVYKSPALEKRMQPRPFPRPKPIPLKKR